MVHKLKRLAGEHTYLRIEGTKQLHTVVGFSAVKRVPDDKELRCSLLHGEAITARSHCDEELRRLALQRRRISSKLQNYMIRLVLNKKA